MSFSSFKCIQLIQGTGFSNQEYGLNWNKNSFDLFYTRRHPETIFLDLYDMQFAQQF